MKEKTHCNRQKNHYGNPSFFQLPTDFSYAGGVIQVSGPGVM